MFKESKLKNSFRILKSGKISLVTTALLLGVATSNLSAVTYGNLDGSNVTISATDVPTPGDDIRLMGTNNQTFTIASDVNINSSTGIGLDFATDTTIINNGTVQGSDYGVSAMMDLGTSFTNNGTITSENGYAFRFEDTSFVNGVDGVVNGSISNWFGSVTNNGLINLSNNTNINSVNTFTNGSTGTLRVNLQTDGTEQGTTYSTLTATDAATFENGSTIDVNVSNSSTNVGLLAGSTLTDVITSTLLTINGTLNITDNSALLNFEYIVNGSGSANGDTTIDLEAVKASTIVDETRTGLGNTNALIIADKLDFIYDNIINFSGMENIIMVLNEKTSSIDIKNAVDSLLPQI